MKNLKKVLALVLAFAMVLGTFTTAFAAEVQNADKAEVLRDLGLFHGKSTTSFVPALEDTATRAEAMKLLAEVLGWDLTNAPAHSFTDVPEWANAYVAVAAAKGVTNGISATEFGADNNVTFRQVLAWLTRELGYGDAYADPSIAADAGLISASQAFDILVAASAGTEADLLRDGLVGVFYKSLTVENKKTGNTVIADLVEAKKVDANKAVAHKLIAETNIKVANLNMTNYKEVYVTFTAAPEKKAAEKVDNYEVKVGSTVLEVSKAALNGNVVTLTLKNPVAKQSEVAVTVKKAVGLVEDFSGKIANVIDYTRPVVDSIKLTGPKSIEITMSEPIDETVIPTVLINNGVFGASVDSVSGKVIKVSLASQLEDGNYDVTVKGAVDFEGLKMADTTRTLAYVEVKDSVTAVIKEASQNKVVVEFSQTLSKTLTAADFYYAYSSFTPDSVTIKDNKTYTLDFTTHMIPEGNWTLLIKKDNVESEWGNKAAADLKLAFNIAIDTVPPTVALKEVVGEDEIKLEFSEAVTSTATDSANYEVKDSANKKVDVTITVTESTEDNEDNVVVVKFSKKLAGGNYTIVVKDVTDDTPQKNKMAETGIVFTVTDKTAPTPEKAEIVGKVIYVTFDEQMNNSAIDTNLYRYNGVKPEKAEFFGSTKVVKLTFKDAITAGNNLAIGQVADLAGNKISALQTEITNVQELTKVAIKSAKAIAKNRVEIVIDGKIVEGIAADNFVFSNAAGTTTATAAYVSFAYNDDNQTVVTAVMKSTIEFAANEAPDTISILGDKLKADTGVTVTTTAFTGAVEGIKPTFVKDGLTVSVANKQATVKFDETLSDALEALIASELVVVNDGKTLVAGIDYTTEVNGDSVVITFTETKNATLTVDKKLKVSVTDSKYIKDTVGNTANNFSQEITIK